MTLPPDEPHPDLEHVADAISDGADVPWDADPSARKLDAETLEALRLIEDVARVHRASVPAPPEPGDATGPKGTWGNLRLRELLGAGAYGEVYRAYDPGLQREVALKLWSTCERPRLIEELLGEARSLARVRHPNVLLVHGADVHDGRVGMWTELVEGASLEHMLVHFGPCHWREAALYGIELCRALAAVHAAGLVHRDVKAANVVRERGGRVVLMDFGSARACAAEGRAPDARLAGTPLAMAPEVLAGAPATSASDLYGVGALLYRQMTGRYPVEADSLDALREKLASEPPIPLRALRPEVPQAFAGVVDRALDRDPSRRPASATEMERLLAEGLSADWKTGTAAAGAPPPAAPVTRRPRRLVPWLGAAAAFALLVAAVLAWRGGFGGSAARPMQFAIQLPPGEHLPQASSVAVAPDGRTLAFTSVDSLGRRALWIRRFDALESTRVPGTDGAEFPFWSPDSRDVGFFAAGWLKRVGIDGDSVRTLCRTELGRGGSWGRRGTIVFCASTQGALSRVPDRGGVPVPASTLESSSGEVSHRWPSFLPDGDHFLYVATPMVGGAYGLYVGALGSDRRVYVGPVESGAAYACGVLVYMLGQTLEARPFDLRSLRWRGEAVPVTDMPGLGGSLAEPRASVSQDGTVAYAFIAARESRLQWVDVRLGVETVLADGPYYEPRLSPDGRTVAVERVEGSGTSNLWMVDAVTGAAERWTQSAALNRNPIWSPEGDSIAYCSNRSGTYEIDVRSTRGSLSERARFAPARALLMWATDWEPGGTLAFDRYEPGTGYNVYELHGDVPVPVACSAANEMHGVFSPDGRWFAFDSDASGRRRIQVMDRRSSETFVLPGEGGLNPRWARATGKLYYHGASGALFEVAPVPGRAPSQWPSRLLFRSSVLAGFDVDGRGERILCCVKRESDRPEEIAVLAHLPEVVRAGR